MTTKEEQEQGGGEWLVDMPPKEIAAQKLKQHAAQASRHHIDHATALATAGGGF